MPTTPRPVVIEFDCTACGYILRAGLDLAGRIVVCPACEARLFVPTEPPSRPGDTALAVNPWLCRSSH